MYEQETQLEINSMLKAADDDTSKSKDPGKSSYREITSYIASYVSDLCNFH